MKLVVMLGFNNKGGCSIKAFISDKKINIDEFTIGKNLGHETGWINARNNSKMDDRFKFLKANKNNYISGMTYNDPEVCYELSNYVNSSSNKLSSMRKIIEIVEGFNCVGSGIYKIKDENGEQYSLREFCEIFL